ncbi:PREDICTED: amyloid beta A4 precursor protein-binding family A member 1 [Cyprinodon variegatus]|uniref:amyloid beta A4 precursor protein-binding family A member 1 n=1 Tax=Cyprinodon variegatus TaxID=28743 RepID=UPI000742860D|nr:PREDICTED: amyloid beta A4 precursor protein-binding family A member 1 [Cyprinodon variegatus]
MEDRDSGSYQQKKCHNGRSSNPGNQEMSILCFEASSAEGNSGRASVPEGQRPQEDDMNLRARPSVSRAAGRRYRRQAESRAQLQAEQESQKQREAEKSHFVHQLQTLGTQNDRSSLVHPAVHSFYGNTGQEFMSADEETRLLREQASSRGQLLNADCCRDVYSQPEGHSEGHAFGTACENTENVYAELYEMDSLSDQVYEEIGDVSGSPLGPAGCSNNKESLKQRGAGVPMRHGHHQKEAVGSRLHHYTQRSDGESDSPEKDAEFAHYPGTNTCYEFERDAESSVAQRSQSLNPVSHGSEAEKLPVEEPPGPPSSNGSKAAIEEDSARHQAASPSEETLSLKITQEKTDSISLVIKDIREAIEEVKTRTIRSPYTPDVPKEPIWVMRQDLSPSMEYDLQTYPGDVEKHEEEQAKQKERMDQSAQSESPRSDPPSPAGAESSSRLLQEEGLRVSPSRKENRKRIASFPTYVEVPGPCDPEDLIDGIIFAASCLGSIQLLSEKTPSKNIRMMQAQEAVSSIKAEPQPVTEVDLFISTQRIKVLNADSQETMIDHPLRTISYIADIGNIVVLMARRRLPHCDSQEKVEVSDPSQDSKHQHKMMCHVFESEDAQLIAQSIGQAFSVAYQEFLRANGINPEDLSQTEYTDLLSTQDMYNEDLVHFSRSENCKDVFIEKAKGEILGVVIVESGWGSILPTVIIANMMHAGPAERSGRVNIGDQIMSINGTSLVGLPLSTCQSIIKGLKNQSGITLNIVRCPPVTTVLIRRPDVRYQLGFSVQNGIVCSLMRGGIAERGGVRVGHRIIEINSQSVVATPHEKIVQILSNAVGEVRCFTDRLHSEVKYARCLQLKGKR